LLEGRTLDNLGREVDEQMQEYYGDIKDYKTNGMVSSLIVEISQFDNLDDQPILRQNSFPSIITTHYKIYNACIQAVIDQLEAKNSPFGKILGKIKLGYTKVLNSYVSKIKDLSYDAESKVIAMIIIILVDSEEYSRHP
jgi:hypothetical protein